MESVVADSRKLASARTATETASRIGSLTHPYPYYIHKWTRQRRAYTQSDLSLPERLFVRGNWPRWNRPVIAIGGTRSPTVDTFCLVSDVVAELARQGALIVSGGVPGVDIAGHIAAADQPGGATVAVLANPVDLGLRGHEWSSAFVEAQILKRGAFVSEYNERCEVGGELYCERLLARDRIISGLCDVFLAFECREDSATVDTAHRAMVQGKQVICIASMSKSSRRGLNQLASDFGLPILEERKLIHAAAIAGRILEMTGIAA